MSEREFQLARLQAQERDKNRCVVCESTDGLVAHHMKKTNGLGVDHSVDNLATLCTGCHSKLKATSPFTLMNYDSELLRYYDKDDHLKVIKAQRRVIEYQEDCLRKVIDNYKDCLRKVNYFLDVYKRLLRRRECSCGY